MTELKIGTLYKMNEANHLWWTEVKLYNGMLTVAGEPEGFDKDVLFMPIERCGPSNYNKNAWVYKIMIEDTVGYMPFVEDDIMLVDS
jgi:hypothetical protein